MSDLWTDLSARSEAHDEFVNSAHARIIGKHIDHLKPKLQVKLAGAAEKCCLSRLTRLVGNYSELHGGTRDYQESAMDVKKNALATIAEDQIAEDQTVEPELPKMPRLPEKRKLGIVDQRTTVGLWSIYHQTSPATWQMSRPNHIRRRFGNSFGRIARRGRELGRSLQEEGTVYLVAPISQVQAKRLP